MEDGKALTFLKGNNVANEPSKAAVLKALEEYWIAAGVFKREILSGVTNRDWAKLELSHMEIAIKAAYEVDGNPVELNEEIKKNDAEYECLLEENTDLENEYETLINRVEKLERMLEQILSYKGELPRFLYHAIREILKKGT
jgi:hypothetical protein